MLVTLTELVFDLHLSEPILVAYAFAKSVKRTQLYGRAQFNVLFLL